MRARAGRRHMRMPVRYVCVARVRVFGTCARVWYVCGVCLRVFGTCVCVCTVCTRVYASLPYRTGPYRRAHMLTLLLLPIVDHAAPYTC